MRGLLFCISLIIGLFFIAVVVAYIDAKNYFLVENEYSKGNIYARELLLNGYNIDCSGRINSDYIEKALRGDRDAIDIVIAQTKAPVAEKKVVHINNTYIQPGTCR